MALKQWLRFHSQRRRGLHFPAGHPVGASPAEGRKPLCKLAGPFPRGMEIFPHRVLSPGGDRGGQGVTVWKRLPTSRLTGSRPTLLSWVGLEGFFVFTLFICEFRGDKLH